jgi:hypothetical protein
MFITSNFVSEATKVFSSYLFLYFGKKVGKKVLGQLLEKCGSEAHRGSVLL